MILRAIAVSGWRCFLEEITVGPFTEGLNVIHAPNGTGKSTLFEAMQRGLLDAHGVTGYNVEAIRPWGRSLAPRVTIEFEHAGQTYRVTKQYLDGATSGLERQEDGRFRPVSEGRAADDEVDLGSSTAEFKKLYVDSVAYGDKIGFGTGPIK